MATKNDNDDNPTTTTKTRRGIDTETIEKIHKYLPEPLGEGKCLWFDPMFLWNNSWAVVIIMAISNRVARGAIPYPMEDLRCSYCHLCHDEEEEIIKCTGCRKVFYCDSECQRKHLYLHKKVCGTVTETWVEKEEFFFPDFEEDDVNDAPMAPLLEVVSSLPRLRIQAKGVVN